MKKSNITRTDVVSIGSIYNQIAKYVCKQWFWQSWQDQWVYTVYRENFQRPSAIDNIACNLLKNIIQGPSYSLITLTCTISHWSLTLQHVVYPTFLENGFLYNHFLSAMDVILTITYYMWQYPSIPLQCKRVPLWLLLNSEYVFSTWLSIRSMKWKKIISKCKDVTSLII